MKKYLYILIVMLCALSSCTDSNEIDIVQQKDVTFNVNIANVYESWGLSSFQNYLGNNKSESIGIMTFIYDKKGQLSQKKVTTSKTFQTAVQSIGKLKAGEYDVVTLVTMINDDDEESSVWDIVGEDTLNTLMVTFKENRSIAYWYEAFGLANVSVQIGENTNVTITPKSVGSLVKVGYENFGASDFNFLSFSSRNNAEGLRLAPNLPDSDRYFRGEYDKSNVWGSIGYFYSRDDKLDSADAATYYTFETGNRPYLIGVAQNMWVNGNTTYDFGVTGEFNFEDGKVYQAFAYYVGKPDIIKTFFGLSSDFNSWYSSLDKTIPVFAQPCTAWGCSVSYVKSYMQDYVIEQDITEDGLGYYMIYTGKYKERWIEYDFESATTGLESIYIPIYKDYATYNDIDSQLLKLGYKYEGSVEEDDDYLGYQMYSNDNTLVGVFLDLVDNYGDSYTQLLFIGYQEDVTRGNSATKEIGKELRLKRSSINKRL